MTSLALPSGDVLRDAQYDHAQGVVHAALDALDGDPNQRRGAVASVACCLVESEFRMWANSNVQASMSIPHDAVGSDHASVGLFQQQVPSWGTALDCMNPKQSTLKFLGLDKRCTQPGLTSLPRYRFDYVGMSSKQHWFDMPIGSAVQAVQVSAFPTRYAQRVTDAGVIVDHFLEDEMNTQQVQTMIDNSLRQLMFGTDGPRHKATPGIAPDPDHGIADRLLRHTQRLNGLVSAVRAQGGKVDDIADDVTDLEAEIKAIKSHG